MSGARYPLQLLLRLRGEICKERELALAGAVQALEAAEQALSRARKRHREQLALVADERHRAFDGMGTTAERRVRQERYIERLEREAALLAAAVRDAQGERDMADADRHRAQGALATAEAERKVVEKNRAAWSEARQRQATARAEAELEDLVAARRRDGLPR